MKKRRRERRGNQQRERERENKRQECFSVLFARSRKVKGNADGRLVCRPTAIRYYVNKRRLWSILLFYHFSLSLSLCVCVLSDALLSSSILLHFGSNPKRNSPLFAIVFIGNAYRPLFFIQFLFFWEPRRALQRPSCSRLCVFFDQPILVPLRPLRALCIFRFQQSFKAYTYTQQAQHAHQQEEQKPKEYRAIYWRLKL